MPPHTLPLLSLFQQRSSDATSRKAVNQNPTQKTTTTGTRERESKKCPLCMRNKAADGCVHAKALIDKTKLKAPFIGLHNSRLLDKCPTSSTKFPEFKSLIESTIDEFTDMVPVTDFTIDKKPYREMLIKHFYQKINNLAIARGIFPNENLNEQRWNEEISDDTDVNSIESTPSPIQNVNHQSKSSPQPLITTPPILHHSVFTQEYNMQSIPTVQQTETLPTYLPKKEKTNVKIKPASKKKQITIPITTPSSLSTNTNQYFPQPIKSEKIPVNQLETIINTPLKKSESDSSLKSLSSTTVAVRKSGPTITTPARRSSLPVKSTFSTPPQKIQKQKIMLKNNKTKKRELMMLSQSDFDSIYSLGNAFIQNREEKVPVDQITFKYPDNGKKIHVNTTGLEVIKELFGKYDLLEFSVGKKQRLLTTPNKP